jgi:hypothetical protein
MAPFAIEASLSGQPEVIAGEVVTPSPRFIIRNASGDILANLPVAITVTKGKGTLRNAPLRTASSGSTSIGEWTLDTLAVTNELTIAAGSAPPLKITIVGRSGPVVRIARDGGMLDGLAGDVSSAVVLRARDRYGNPVRGISIELAIATGGGDVSPHVVTTDAAGVAAGVMWRLGRLGGPQRLVATSGAVRADIDASIRSGFNPNVRSAAPLPASIQEALTAAVNRLNAAVIGDLADVPVFNFDMSRCGLQSLTLSETIDDVVIFAIVAPIDGAGKILASAGPCILRTQSRLPLIGLMRFDADDIGALAENGRLNAVVLHEMLHVIGFGPLWRDLLAGSGGSNPKFTGALAAAQCIAAGGLSDCSDGRVPVENTGGSGTAEVHWRESVFDSEVMTGFVEGVADMPFSSMTIASLADLGYTINLLARDPFQVPVPGSVSPRLSPQLLAPWEIISLPLFEITPAGVLRSIPR